MVNPIHTAVFYGSMQRLRSGFGGFASQMVVEDSMYIESSTTTVCRCRHATSNDKNAFLTTGSNPKRLQTSTPLNVTHWSASAPGRLLIGETSGNARCIPCRCAL
ncbi:hypothetical protein Acel_0037 [Acidothermus cellulolyticus 11B]|uniref:Uncharacterized protein n=1 Tax=Acidothermus cellulolyticus (strain ATCC 43068 / DSM 8971 / 11B) TaxID=351607 RepID=A0LQV3_ACIC1|nr:hypothetical protein Acel_0037 [Acidothermus cellulolyticus 11B]